LQNLRRSIFDCSELLGTAVTSSLAILNRFYDFFFGRKSK
jgi:hypothetical protein